MSTPFSWRVLLFVMFLSALAVGAVWTFPAWRMPGAVSLAHAVYENECDKCHLPWVGVNAAGCLGCHPSIIENGSESFHTPAQRQCDACHVEHRGRDVYIVPTERGVALKDSCVNCHTNRKLLNATAEAHARTRNTLCPDCAGGAPSMQTGESFYVDAHDLLETPHGQAACTDCHGGDSNALAKVGAHKNLIADPSADPAHVCGQAGCHSTKAASFKTSLHATAQGFFTVVKARSDDAHWNQLAPTIEKCAGQCHATCGQCHVGKLLTGGVGLQANHAYTRQTPLENSSCAACHDRRVNQEYLGKAKSAQPDVHFKAHLGCLDCHPTTLLHGDRKSPAAMQDVPVARTCVSCHSSVLSGKTGNAQHDLHGDKVTCWVCHAQAYQNCYGCHFERTSSGDVIAKTQREEIGLKIGKVTDSKGGTRYGLVFHAPMMRNSFSFFGDNLLPRFDDVPTWKPIEPHNIQRRTPQNASCAACHSAAAIWLKPSDLDPADSQANQSVTTQPVPMAPR